MTEPFGVKFGEMVRAKRAGLKQSEVARAVGLSESYISRLENGHTPNPDPGIWQALATYLVINERELAVCRGEDAPSVDLRDIAWLDFRAARRRYLHPRLNNGPLVTTPTLQSIASMFSGGRPSHLLIEGEIASGKSSLLELLLEAWRNINPMGHVLLLPLGGDYSAGSNWNTSVALLEFLSRVEAAALATRTKHLIVIEDAHEMHVDGRTRYLLGRDRPVDLNSMSLIVTSRPQYVDLVRSDVEAWSLTKLRHVMTNPFETAQALVEAAVESHGRRAEFRSLFAQLGSSLVALAAAMTEGAKRKDEPVTRELAFRAVSGELNRICDPEGVSARGEDISRLKVGLLCVWMLGSMECEFDELALGRLMNETDTLDLLRVFEANKELFFVEEGRLRCSRHPAWGQLVMLAIDEFPSLELLSKDVTLRLTTSASRPDLAASTKCLTAFLYAMLFQKMMTPDELGFRCTGRHMHEEFAEAGRLYVEGGRNRFGPVEEDRLQTLRHIASGIRRSNPRDFEQRQALLDQAGKLMEDVTKLAKEEGNVVEDADLPGPILYEIAYLHSLRGDLDAARLAFQQSKVQDLRLRGREHFGIMSGVRESIMLTYLGERIAAKECLDPLETLLRQLEANLPKDRGVLLRFQANLVHARLEIAIAGRYSGEARRLVEEYTKTQEQSGSSTALALLYTARVALLEEDFKTAKAKAAEALALREIAGSAESYYLGCRVLGDACLGMALLEEAIAAYRAVVPERSSPRHRDFETGLVEERLRAIGEGHSGKAVLRSAHL